MSSQSRILRNEGAPKLGYLSKNQLDEFAAKQPYVHSELSRKHIVGLCVNILGAMAVDGKVEIDGVLTEMTVINDELGTLLNLDTVEDIVVNGPPVPHFGEKTETLIKGYLLGRHSILYGQQ